MKGSGKMQKVLVVGSVNMDCVIRLRQRPRRGETVFCDDVSHVPGGKGANQAYALGRLGVQAKLIGAVGDDEFGRASLANLESAGVDISPVRVSPNEATGRAFIEVEADGQNSIIVLGGANVHLGEGDLLTHLPLFEWCDAVVMQLETPLETMVAASRLAKERGKLVFLDPAPARPDLPAELWPLLDVLKPNETELQILSGLPTKTEDECLAAARVLLQRGVGKVLVTRGGDGSLLVGPGWSLSVPAFPVKPVDTTAAGDCFNAAFISKLDGDNYAEAMTYKSAAAAIAVTRPGAQTSLPTTDEVEALVQQRAAELAKAGERESNPDATPDAAPGTAE